MAYSDDVTKLYQQQLGRAPDASGMAYYQQQLQSGMTPQDIAREMQSSQEAKTRQANTSGANLFNLGNVPNMPNGTPDYMALANKQSEVNLNNAQMQYNLNNPNVYGPGGSQVRTKNSDGTYSLTQSLSPDLQASYDAQNKLQTKLLGNASQIAGGPGLSYGGAPSAPTYSASGAPALAQFDTSGVSAIPQSDANNLNTTRDSLYSQQTQYLDPQFQQAQSDLDAKLANQGIMPGSEAYERENNNLALSKQKAYSDARNSAIQAGGAEQSRLFGIGLQSNQAGQANALNEFNTGLQAHTTGTNDALANFNTGLQSRQQGVSEANALHNAPINDLASLRTGAQVALPTYGGQVGTSIPGVDYMNAANLGYNATTGVNNANLAAQTQTQNGLFGLGSALVQNPSAVKDAYNWFAG